MEKPELINLLIAFCDLTNFAKFSSKSSNIEVFNYLSKFYEITGDIIEKANGKILKFIGDSALIIFNEEDIDAGIIALKKLKTEIDQYNKNNNIESRLIIKAHYGQVAYGMLGTKKEKKMDILGSEVNTAALLKSNGFAISVETFRKLKSDTRKMFKKHTPPITYIDIDDFHKD